MTIRTDLQQLIDAVGQRPGAPAYALLAEHYLQLGQLSQALAVCAAGFAANPSYERGATVYLRTLEAQTRQDPAGLVTARHVYERAVALQPGSTKVRLVWARMLAREGHDSEARLRAREAAELDPMSREARDLLESLRGTPPPALRHTGGPGLLRAVLQLGEGDPEQSPSPPPAWSEASTASPSEERSANPSDRATTAQVSADPAHKAAPADTPAETAAQLAPLASAEAVHELFDVTPGPGNVQRAQTTPPSLTGPTARQTASTQRTTQPGQRATQAGARGDTAGLRPTPLGQGVASGPLPGQAAPFAAAQGRSRRSPLLLATLAVALAGGIALLVFHVARKRAAQRAEQRLTELMRLAARDTYHDLRTALGVLESLVAKEPSSARQVAARALIAAHLSTRFRPDDARLKQQSLRAARLAATVAPDLGWSLVAQSLQRWATGDAAAALALLDRVSTAARDWHYHLARALALEGAGELANAAMQLDHGLDSPGSPALLSEGLRLARLRGQPTTRLLEAGLREYPTHLGLRIQQALMRATRKTPPSAAEVEQLARQSSMLPRHRAEVMLVRAHLLRRHGKINDAVQLLDSVLRSGQLAAGSIQSEIGWNEGKWRLPPGGNVDAALQLLNHYGPVMERYRRSYLIWRALALFLAGKTQQAEDLLERPPLARRLLSRAERILYDALSVRLADKANQTDRLAGLCPERAGRRRHPQQVIACVETHLTRSKPAQLNKWVKALAQRSANAGHYLAGRVALARGDFPRAIRQLESSRTTPSVDEAQRLQALGEAYLGNDQPERGVTILRQASKAAGLGPRVRIALACALVAAGHDTEATDLLEQVLHAKPTDPEMLGRIGQAMVDLGRLADASEIAAQLARQSPQSGAARLLSGHIALLQGRPEEARQQLLAVLRGEPQSAVALTMLGRIAARQNNLSLARQYLEQALRLRPKDPALHLLLAKVRARSGDTTAAYRHGKVAINLLRRRAKPRRAQLAMVTLGNLLAAAKDRLSRKRGHDLLAQSTESADAPAVAFLAFGRALIAEGRPAQALGRLRRAVALDPRLAAAQLELGSLLAKLGRTRQAHKALKIYLELVPDGPEADRARALLRRGR